MNIICESLNEFIYKDEDRWADIQIDRWKMKKKGIDPLKIYIDKVVNIIYNDIPDNIIQYTGTDRHIIEDIITTIDNWQLIDMTVYDFWEEDKSEEEAATELGKALYKYIIGQADTM